MATMMERKAESVRKELEKLNARLERQQKKLVKETANAEKLNAICTREEWFGGMREKFTNEQAWAWIEWTSAQEDIQETKGHIENAQKRLDKLTGKVEEQREAREKEEAVVARCESIERRMLTQAEQEANAAQRKAEYERWLAEFKAECLKDGIIIDNACGTWFDGTAANGKRFYLDRNNGWTERSRHCYTLTIGGVAIFTSGEFNTAYRYLMQK